MMTTSDIVTLYVEILQLALPFTFIFWVCEMITTTILRTAFGGRLSFRTL